MEACSKLRMVIVPFAEIAAATRELMPDFPHVTVHNLLPNAAAAGELPIVLFLAPARQLTSPDRAPASGDRFIRYADPSGSPP
jgi:hypothetical protein